MAIMSGFQPENRGSIPLTRSNPKSKQCMVNDIFSKVNALLKSWGLTINDWVVTGKHARRFLGYPITVRKNHINVVINNEKIPWEVKYLDFAETIPNKNSSFFKSLLKFSSETDYDLDITAVNPKLFNIFSKNKLLVSKGNTNIYCISILDNIQLVTIKLDHCTQKELGVQKGIRLVNAIKNLLEYAEKKNEKTVIETCSRIIKKYKFKEMNNTGDTFKGMPIGNGKVSGKVAIIKENQKRKIYDPMILVTHEFTPKQLLYFNELLGIITETGGLTSHAAIVSNELKLPVILQVKNATTILNDGDYITMNLDSGIIEGDNITN